MDNQPQTQQQPQPAGTLIPVNDATAPAPAAPVQASAESASVKELELDGYKFKVDTDLLDDVDAFALINKIENENQITAVVPLMHFLVGKEAFDKIKQHFIDADGEANKDKPDYKPRMRIAKLGEIYQVIIKNFDPKD